MKFSISSVNVTKETADLVTFTEKILNGKLHSLCSDSIFDEPSTLSVLSKSVLAHMSLVSSSGMLAKRKSTSISRFPIKCSETCSTISSAKANEFFLVCSLLVKGFKIGTRNFVNL